MGGDGWGEYSPSRCRGEPGWCGYTPQSGGEDIDEGLQQLLQLLLLLLAQVLATPLKEVMNSLSGLRGQQLGHVRWLNRNLGRRWQ